MPTRSEPVQVFLSSLIFFTEWRSVFRKYQRKNVVPTPKNIAPFEEKKSLDLLYENVFQCVPVNW